VIHRVSQSPELSRHVAFGPLLKVAVAQLDGVPDKKPQRPTYGSPSAQHDHDRNQRRNHDHGDQQPRPCDRLAAKTIRHCGKLLRS
jgi:hypothetical protein